MDAICGFVDSVYSLLSWTVFLCFALSVLTFLGTLCLEPSLQCVLNPVVVPQLIQAYYLKEQDLKVGLR